MPPLAYLHRLLEHLLGVGTPSFLMWLSAHVHPQEAGGDVSSTGSLPSICEIQLEL